MSTPLPPIYRDCRRFLVHTEEMVRRFSRYHQYTGSQSAPTVQAHPASLSGRAPLGSL